MKYFYVGLLILCLLFCACFFSSKQVSRRSEEMIGSLEHAMASSRLMNEMQRDRHAEHASALWRQNRGFFSTVISHSIILNVSEDMEELRSADGKEFDRICGRLLVRLKSIKEMDRPNLENIL